MERFQLFNTLSNKIEEFKTLDDTHLKMYVCGPTVYSCPHLGNARSFVFYDLLFRIFKSYYPKVTYIRNITDVDDKIINRSKSENISEKLLTTQVISEFHEDTKSLNCLPPTLEPLATEYIPQMVEIIELLLQKNHAYRLGKDILFDVKSYINYGQLSNRKIEDMLGGARIAITENKKNNGDFVLWKNAEEDQYGFKTTLGYGRPGWHIECSAMSNSLLGENFDIHGGGVDLTFPHHENEIAQSKCAFPGSEFAKYWIHNGFLMINGEKMSKSLGNFTTVSDLTKKGINPLEIRLSLLSTHYRKPLDFTDSLISLAKNTFAKFHKVLEENSSLYIPTNNINFTDIPKLAQQALFDNINISKYIALMHTLPKEIKNIHEKDPEKAKLTQQFWNMGALIGIFT